MFYDIILGDALNHLRQKEYYIVTWRTENVNSLFKSSKGTQVIEQLV